MEFPPTNKYHRDLNETFGANAKLLEDSLAAIKWAFFLRLYAAGMGILLVTVFAFIVVVRAAMLIF